MAVFTPTWWAAAGKRAAYTALAAVLPAATLLALGDVHILYVAGMAAAAALLSLATSLAGIPETTGTAVPLWRAIATRTLKTAGQVALPALAAVTVVTELDWQGLAVQVGGAALTTLIRTVMAYLPEVEPASPPPTGDVIPFEDEVDLTPPPEGYVPRHLADG
jgi:hypothetical protein